MYNKIWSNKLFSGVYYARNFFVHKQVHIDIHGRSLKIVNHCESTMKNSYHYL